MIEIEEAFEKIAEFARTFEVSEDPELWRRLVAEERKEVQEAAAALLKELLDLTYVVAGYAHLFGEERAETELGPALSNTLLNDLIEAFSDVGGEAFRRVHTSNMSKLGDDGKPIRREDGKIMKGPNYKPPVLDDLVVI